MAEWGTTTLPISPPTKVPSSDETCPATVEIVLSDSALQISDDNWFSLLKDEGTAMTEAEIDSAHQ